MPNKHYADVAAARHMRDWSQEPRPRASKGHVSAVTAGEDNQMTARAPKPRRDKAYRRKRLVALVVSLFACLSVPALILLLVLFG
ncbi:hypothetical protein [Arthrobacter sp. zg-Y1143]|uniref:hypothetical protein n=1 Tax=Arthrobacter sp. zg-Y1143 TaxID=3049065 RepID=UPI0024C23EFB|nr:hypothetical protein [Arthrobacter sp. zg-Y1143]MDK1329043.1 hypothetical protein [Arthrobacter sp. zg-Y1143]